jgi:hypothetical protein
MIRGIKVWLATLLALGCLAPLRAEAQPTPPATFSGSASIDGKPAPNGTAIQAFIGGRDCTQPGAPGTVLQGGVALYRIEVLAESQLAGCGSEGRVITFTIAGLSANQTATWKAAVQTLELTASTATPQPEATPAPITATPATPATPAPTGSVAAPGTQAPASPSPLALVGSGSPETGFLSSDSQSEARPAGTSGFPVFAVLGLGIVGVLGTTATALWWRRRSTGRHGKRSV